MEGSGKTKSFRTHAHSKFGVYSDVLNDVLEYFTNLTRLAVQHFIRTRSLQVSGFEPIIVIRLETLNKSVVISTLHAGCVADNHRRKLQQVVRNLHEPFPRGLLSGARQDSRDPESRPVPWLLGEVH